MAAPTTLLVHDLTSDAVYCDHFRVEAYSDSGLTTLVASGISKAKWDGAVHQQISGIYLEGLAAGTTYYLRWGPVAPQTGLISWSATETVAIASASTPSATFTPTYFPVSSGVTYVVTPSSVSSDVDHYEAYFNLTGTTPSASQVPSFKCIGDSITDDFHFFVGGTPGTLIYTWVRAVNTGTGASAWHALSNQTVVNFVGNLDNIADGTTYDRLLATETNVGHVARIQGYAVSASAPSAGNVLKYVSSVWTPTTPALADDSADVLITSPADAEVLTYEASSSKWKNKPSGGGGGSSTSLAKGGRRMTRIFNHDGQALISGTSHLGDYCQGLGSSAGNENTADSTHGVNDTRYSFGVADTYCGWYGGPGFYRNPRNIDSLFLAFVARTTDIRFWVGFAATGSSLTVSGTPTNRYAMFRYSDIDGDSNFQACSSDGSSQTVVDTGIAADTNMHRFGILFDDVTPSLKFYIDGILVATITTNLPGAGGLIYVIFANWHSGDSFPSALVGCGGISIDIDM